MSDVKRNSVCLDQPIDYDLDRRRSSNMLYERKGTLLNPVPPQDKRALSSYDGIYEDIY